MKFCSAVQFFQKRPPGAKKVVGTVTGMAMAMAMITAAAAAAAAVQQQHSTFWPLHAAMSRAGQRIAQESMKFYLFL